MQRFRRFEGFRLFASIFVSMVAVFLLFSYLRERQSEQAWLASFDRHGRQTAAVLERALSYGMLLGHKEGVRAALADLAAEPGVAAIRIYDKQGKIVFSSDTSELRRRFGKEEPACATCHEAEKQGRRPLEKGESWTYRDARGRLLMGSTQLIESSRDCANASCHQHADGTQALGVLDLRMNMDLVDDGRRAAQKSTLVTAVWMAVAGGLVTAAFIWLFVRRPVQRLLDGTRRVAAAGFHTRIPVDGSGELSEIAYAFNEMTAALETAHARTERWEADLQAAVEQKTEELGRAHEKLVQMERMASLGKLAATVAHELNNPLAGILVYAKLVDRELGGGALSADARTETRRWVDVICSESARCGEIVKNLLTFARQSKAEMAECSLREVVDRSIATVRHLLEQAGVSCRVSSSLTSDRVVCDKNQIQQALVALLVNAVEAMQSGGELALELSERAGQVQLIVRDTGLGIPADVLPHVFEPFVTTKEEKGVGLGLSVVYGIVRRHDGQVEVESEVGKGTTFRITLPREGAKEPPTR